ncbi:MAG: pyrroloquinoline quinone biosynthesis protein PqqC [Legionellales bacterium]|nr:pyrroloquinoline quinone biosynthesis protein PqqC [Legionellales bacterium]|tara:strand:- start:3038 stop:3688 length:651 start_codon:yes stop_codon:yes gene_type:complete
MFSKQLNQVLDQYHLLKHPFYQAWSKGELNRVILKDYAEQYYHHVAAFPRYISATHSLCDDIEKRKVLLENLVEEESTDHDHPKLWKQFAQALGSDHPETTQPEAFTQAMIDNFFRWARSSYAEGLGALYTYERQVPEVADVKIEGLTQFYGVHSKEGLQFFEVHRGADVQHRQDCEKLLDGLTPEEQTLAKAAAEKTAQFLWNFLSGISQKHQLH